jgi:hypothetical protein
MANRTVQFLVTLTGSEPPPDWEEKVEKILRKELGFAFGSSLTEIKKYVPPFVLTYDATPTVINTEAITVHPITRRRLPPIPWEDPETNCDAFD